MRRTGLATTEVNIWADPEAAATVRSIADGNETVPTVVVAGRGLVNPSARAVLDALRAVAPDLVANLESAGKVRRVSVLAVLQWVVVVVLLAASFAVETAGHPGASWSIDGVNLVIYAGLRVIRRRFESSRALGASTGGGAS